MGHPASAQVSDGGLFDKLQIPSGDVGVQRDGDDYLLIAPMADGRYWGVDLWLPIGAPYGADGNHQLGASFSMIGGASVDQEAAGATFTGGGFNWATAPGPNDQSFGGSYRFTSVAGSASWTSPAAPAVGVRHVATTNGGYAKATLNGSTTAATALPTAQQEVDAGRLASTALIANGGTLDPADRLLDNYRAGGTDWDKVTMLAYDLAETAHTILLEWTGYAHPNATSQRVYVSGFVTGPDPSPTADLIPTDQIHWPFSAWEYAHDFTPTGGTERHFIGTIHGNETQVSLSFEVDGVDPALLDGERAWGSSVVVVRESTLQHPEAVGNVANVTTTYTMDSEGLRVRCVTNWLQSGEVRGAYVMMPVNASLDRCTIAGLSSVTGSTGGDVYLGNAKSQTVVCWQQAGTFAAGVRLNNTLEAMAGWRNSAPRFACLHDRGGGQINKVYMSRIGNSITPETTEEGAVLSEQAGNVWVSDATYRAARSADPEALLAVA